MGWRPSDSHSLTGHEIKASTRVRLFVFVALLLAFCWLAMQAVHELGHVINAWLSGGTVVRVVLHPLAISRTDVSPNPHPQFVAWGGAIWGTMLPLAALAFWRVTTRRWSRLLTFFAGFCCLANGLYLTAGSFGGVGDAGDLLRHGASVWQLWLFGVPAIAGGIWLWHRLGPRFGLRVSIPEP